MHVTPSRLTRGGKPHNITIQGKAVSIYVAKITYKCIFCLANLEIKNSGLICPDNANHYGYIHRDEARELPEELRFMKISDMFPSEYIRGIDIHQPTKVQIRTVKQETSRDRETGEVGAAYVLYFEGMKKGVRLNLTMAKEVALILNDADFDTDNWTGGWVTIYRTKLKAFGKEHIVPRIRAPQRNDKVLETDQQASKPKNGNGKEKPFRFPNTKAEEFWQIVQQATGEYYQNPGHMLNAIGGWFNFADGEEWNARLSLAIDHAQKEDNKQTAQVQMGLGK